MTKGEVEYAERQALMFIDQWLKCVGIFTPGDGYYQELCGIVEEAVHCGIQTALFGDVKYDLDSTVCRTREEKYELVTRVKE